MNFSFTEVQVSLRDGVTRVLQDEVTPQSIRKYWEQPEAHASRLWSLFTELGLPGLLVPEKHGGLGLGTVDFVLIAEECGRFALPGEMVDKVMVAIPWLADLATESQRCNELLGRVLRGEQRVVAGDPATAMVADADLAEWLILQRDDAVHLVSQADVTLARYESVDPSRRLFAVEWKPTKHNRITAGKDSQQWRESAFNRGALGTAAQLLGLARGMLERAAQYAGERRQFNKPIGSFQAVKHLLADPMVRLSFSRPVVHHASFVLDSCAESAKLHVSHAKSAASAAALHAARHSLQVHGAVGYTWEHDLHIWMKRAWALAQMWGTTGFHRRRLDQWILDSNIDPRHLTARADRNASGEPSR